MKYLVVIPARGGSKGVPKKNIKLLKSKPLIHYTIEVAKQIVEDKYICVTTDDNEIKEVVEEANLKVPFMRPKEFASDTSGSYEVIIHAINYYENNGYCPDVIIFLQPTSPFRTADHIKAALKLYDNDIDMVVSVKETKSNPYYLLFEEDNLGYLNKSKLGNFKRRQDCPKVWELNGALYIINVNSLKKQKIGEFEKIKKYEMDEMSSHDIDTLFDWKVAESIINNLENKYL